MFVSPLTAALLLSSRQSGFDGLKALFKRAFDYQKIKQKIWYVPILLLSPGLYVLSYLVMRVMGWPLPDPISIPLLLAPVFFCIYFLAGICEELGWMGYAFDPLQNRWGVFKAGLILGIVWQLWHLIPDLQAHYTASWIIWHDLQGVALRLLIVWIYTNTGKSVFAAILVHAMDNVSWSLFPNYGSGFDPFVTGMLTIIAAVIVIIGWGPNLLARQKKPLS
ncbi:MAG: CPBP family intramembrane metalloprotease [Ktedonobacteraceae bacterium]|nr:CPBP family intramembrane metalloprotease [Ktedonobacteraceae bacterium]